MLALYNVCESIGALMLKVFKRWKTVAGNIKKTMETR
jgi:hypothetical protein